MNVKDIKTFTPIHERGYQHLMPIYPNKVIALNNRVSIRVGLTARLTGSRSPLTLTKPQYKNMEKGHSFNALIILIQFISSGSIYVYPLVDVRILFCIVKPSNGLFDRDYNIRGQCLLRTLTYDSRFIFWLGKRTKNVNLQIAANGQTKKKHKYIT